MFGVDFSEIALIFLIALVVLGPAKLPQVAATIGRWVGRARVMARQFREQLEQEADQIKRDTDLRPRPPTPPPAAPMTATPMTAAPMTAAPAAAPMAAAPPTAAMAASPAASPMNAPPPSADALPESAAPLPSGPEHQDHPASLPAEPHERGS
jgi:sec-independent protein translocase protein TatB